MTDQPQRSPWLAGLLFTLAAMLLLAWVQAPSPGLYGYDGPYHIRYSERLGAELARTGEFPSTFPAWQETFLRKGWADKDLLYHLLLIPFTFGPDLLAQGKAASILFGTLLAGSLFAALASLHIRPVAPWAAMALIGSTTLLYRAGLLRSHVLAISLAILGAAAILRERRIASACLAFLYALTHVAWHLLPIIALIHDVARGVSRQRWRWQGTLACAGGTLAAILVNPYFPANLKLWWVQNVSVLSYSWSAEGADLGLGLEMVAGRPADLLFYNPGPLLLTAVGLAGLALAARRRLLEPASLTLGTVAIGFFALSFLSRRFPELWSPFSGLFAAAAVQSLRRPASSHPSAEPGRFGGRRVAAGALITLVIGAVGLHAAGQARRIVGEDPGLIFEGCATWLRDHVPPGGRVVTTDWDEFPELYFVAPELHYLVGLDPTFMKVTSPERFDLWRSLAEGRAADLPVSIEETFLARHLFIDAGFSRLRERAEQDPLLRLEVATPECAVYSVRERATARGTPFEATWRLQGQAREIHAKEAAFVDLAPLADGPDAAREECMVLEGSLSVAGRDPGPLTLAFSSDDPMEILAGGRTILKTGVAEATDLEDILAEHRAGGRHGIERRARLEAAPGPVALTLKSCRAGEAWGFHLRLPGGERGE